MHADIDADAVRQQGALYRPPLTKVHAESVGHQCGRYDLLRFSPTYDADGVAFHICAQRVFRSDDSGASWAAVSVPQRAQVQELLLAAPGGQRKVMKQERVSRGLYVYDR